MAARSGIRHAVLVFLALSACLQVNAQPPWVWAKGMGGTGGDDGAAVAVDASGNVYSTGVFFNTVDFDPGDGSHLITSLGCNDIFISKLNAAGEFMWARRVGSSTCEYSSSMALDNSGNVFITGRFQSNMDFDPGDGVFNLSTAGTWDIYVLKLDPSGNFGWAAAMGGTDVDIPASVTCDVSGNVYTTGEFNGTADFDPGTEEYNITSAGASDVFVSKISAAGSFVSAISFGGTDYDEGQCIRIADNGNMYITGWFSSTADFDPGDGTFNLTSLGGHDVFVSKLDAAGNLLFAVSVGGTSNDHAFALDYDRSGNVCATGSFNGTVDFDPGAGSFNITSVGNGDIVILKLDDAGSFEWAKAIGGTTSDQGSSLDIDDADNIYSSGYFSSTADFDPGTGTYNLTAAGSGDIYVSKLDVNGDFVWALAAGGSGSDWSKSLFLDLSANTYIAGYFSNPSAMFGSVTLTSAGGSDAFVAKVEGSSACSLVTNTDDEGTGSLRYVIECAQEGDTIHFHNTLTDQTITLASGEIIIKNNLIISGLGADHLTLSGNSISRIFHVRPGWNLDLSNITLANASSSTDGGAILNDGNLTLNQVRFQDNYENGLPKAMTISPGASVTIIGAVEVND